MNNSHDGNQANSSPDLPAGRTPVTTTTTEVSTPDAPVGGPVTSITYPLPPDLAARARYRRSKRLVRTKIVSAEYRMKDRVGHPDGGDRPVEEILQDEAAQRAQIEAETRQGSRKHLRLPPWLRWIPKFVLAFDFGLLLYFFAGITNVNWASALSSALAFAMLLAAMVTVLSYGFLAFTGHRLRSHKDHEGTVHHDELDEFTKAAFGVALAVIAVLSTLMFLRMRTEVIYALGARAQITALVIAIALAVVSAVANFLVIAIHALDGSDQVARLDRLSAAARRPFAKAHRMREQAARQAEE
ncbi:MAG: hypothetical protein ACM3ML_08035 [Micromonosporaceae bacterium]